MTKVYHSSNGDLNREAPLEFHIAWLNFVSGSGLVNIEMTVTSHVGQ